MAKRVSSVSEIHPEQIRELQFLRLVAGQITFDEVMGNKDVIAAGDYRAAESYIKHGGRSVRPPLSLSKWYVDYCGGMDEALQGRLSASRLAEVQRYRETVTTAGMTSIVKNALNVLLANEYSQREQWWGPIVRQENVDTLDQATLVRTYGLNSIAVVPEGSTYQELAWEDQEETASYVKHGNYVGITLETLLQDKVGVVRNMPIHLADSWYNTVSDLVSSVFTVNSQTGPVLGTTGALFNATAITNAAGHVNLLTTALSYSEWHVVRRAMQRQTSQPLGVGRRLLIEPKYLLIPLDLESLAIEMRESELVPNQQSGGETGGANLGIQTVNTIRGTFEYIVVPQWTDANNWAAVADPVQNPAIWLIWLNGKRVPELVTADAEGAGAMFTNDVLRFKVRQFLFRFSDTYDCAPVSDFRPLHKSNV